MFWDEWVTLTLIFCHYFCNSVSLKKKTALKQLIFSCKIYSNIFFFNNFFSIIIFKFYLQLWKKKIYNVDDAKITELNDILHWESWKLQQNSKKCMHYRNYNLEGNVLNYHKNKFQISFAEYYDVNVFNILILHLADII